LQSHCHSKSISGLTQREVAADVASLGFQGLTFYLRLAPATFSSNTQFYQLVVLEERLSENEALSEHPSSDAQVWISEDC
jgi:hypothetical protein